MRDKQGESMGERLSAEGRERARARGTAEAVCVMVCGGGENEQVHESVRVWERDRVQERTRKCAHVREIATKNKTDRKCKRG